MKTTTPARARAFALCATLFILAPPASAQLGCEVPLFVQQGSVDANVMILFDNSGSMNEMVYHPDYDHNMVYTDHWNSNNVYGVGSSGNYTFNGRTARLVTSFGGQNGRYRGNYLNWIYYHATAAQRATIPEIAQIHVAHDVVSDIIDRTERVRFGVTVFRTGGDPLGGTVIAECGTDKATLVTTVRNIVANTWTPLGETMETIVNYYKRTDASGPIQAWCQHSFVVVVTDGMPTMDHDVSMYLRGPDPAPATCAAIGSPDPESNKCSHFFPWVAAWMYENDLRPDLAGTQNAITYTIGFNIDAPLLLESAVRGGGLYMSAGNAAELWTSLELVMLDIINRISSGSAVAVVSTERGDGDRLYRGKFMPGSWHGYLESFELPYEQGDHPIWEAGYLLMQRSAASRVIHAGVGNSFVPFTTGNANTLSGPMGVADAAEATPIIEWTRGQNVADLRERNNWKLGDIIHSTPVVVGAPANFSHDWDYQAFMAANVNRTRTVYVGANDGMLHAFRAEDGQETWAFIPEFALPKLEAIADTTYCHTYSVDLTPTVRDCKIGGVWKTVLVGGGRQGGAGYFALDVTDPAAPQLLWQIELPDGKPFASEVTFAVINDQPVVLIGSGLDTTDGNAWLHIYTVADGVHRGSVLLSSDSSRRNKATAATAVSIVFDGNHEYCYVADLQGHVWKLVFNGTTNTNLWDVYCLWSGGADAEITGRPIAVFGAQVNHVYVYFGTGAYLVEDDIQTDDDHIFGCIFDRQDGATYASLVDQTSSDDANIMLRDGWYIELENADGERVTEPALVVAGKTYFTSFVPSEEVCEAGGRSWLYRVDYRTGRPTNEGAGDPWDGDASIDLGQGVASRAVVDLIRQNVIVQSSDATIHMHGIGGHINNLRVRAWQEHYDFNP